MLPIPRLSRARGLALICAVTLVTALAAGHPGWAGPALAQTVPTVTKTPGPGGTATPTQPAPPQPGATQPAPPQPGATQPAPTAEPESVPGEAATPGAAASPTRAPSVPAAGACSPAEAASAAVLTLPVTLRLASGSVTLFSNTGRTAVSPSAVPVASLATRAVLAGSLPPAPPGLAHLGCGLAVTAESALGEPLTYLTSGLLVCLAVPPEAAADARVAYYDASPAIDRWVLLPTRAAGGLACGPRFRLPATFALLAAGG